MKTQSLAQRTSFFLVLFLSMVPLGCGGDSSGPTTEQIQRLCEVACRKAEDCEVNAFETQSECREVCVDKGEDDSKRYCPFSDSEFNTCMDAYEELSCNNFPSEPPECDFCGDGDGIGSNNPSGGQPGSDSGTSSGACLELQVCCDAINDPDTKNVCLSSAEIADGDDASCDFVLDLYSSDCT